MLHVVEATTGGVGRHVIDLSTRMQRAGLDVTVACPPVREDARADTRFVGRLQAAGVPVLIVPMRRSIHPLADLRAYVCLAQLMRRRDYDVVHTHSSKAGFLGRLAAADRSRWVRRGRLTQSSRPAPAVVYTPNAFAFLGAGNAGLPWLGPTLRWLYCLAERWLGQHFTDALICVSRSELVLAEQQAVASPERLVLIENAIDVLQVVPTIQGQSATADRTAAPPRGSDSGRPVVGYIGRMARQKGIVYLIEAARQVVAAQPEVRFLLVGEGECEGALRRAVMAHGLQDHVMLAGYRTDVPQVLAALDVFVLPSLYEGLPYTLMEAMAAGRAVVATDVGGNCDLVRHGETGLLVPPRDAQALAAALLRLLSAPEERERLGRAAQAAARSRPTPEQMADRTIGVYLKILQKKRD